MLRVHLLWWTLQKLKSMFECRGSSWYDVFLRSRISTINKIFLRLDLKKSEPAVVRPNVLSAAQTGLQMKI